MAGVPIHNGRGVVHAPQESFLFLPRPEKVPAVSNSLVEIRLSPYGQRFKKIFK
jgi:hypothetical protein